MGRSVASYFRLHSSEKRARSAAAVHSVLEIALLNFRQADLGTGDAVLLRGHQPLLIERVAPDPRGMVDMVFHDFVTQDFYSYANELQSEIDIRIFPSGSHKSGVESVDFFQIFLPQGKVGAEDAAPVNFPGEGQHEAMLNHVDSTAKPQPNQSRRAQSYSSLEDLLGRGNVLARNLGTPARQSHARLNVAQVIAHEIAVGEAIGVDENKIGGPADQYRPILNARFAKAQIFMPDVLDGLGESRRPALQHWAVILGRTIISDDDLKILTGLAREGGQVPLNDIGIVVTGDDDGSAGNIPRTRRVSRFG